MKRLGGLALLILLCGCSDDDDGGNGPDEAQLTGTWTGIYTNTLAPPNTELEAVLDIVQTDDEVEGTLTVNTTRLAQFSGTVTGDQLDVTFIYGGECPGTATGTATLVDETDPPSLEGTYTLTDCLDESSGTFSLVKEE